MKAAVYEKVKSPVNIVDDYQTPAISDKSGKAIIDIVACGVCHTDLGYLDHGVPTFKKPPLILGHEISGIIKEVSDDVNIFQKGDHVIIPAVLTCGYCFNCRIGRENICTNQIMLGNHVDGGFAEQIMVSAKDVYHLPSEIPLEEGCIISDAVSTPYHAVKNRGQVNAGDWVIVIGCGGIGLNLIQNIKVAGGLPIAIDIMPEKLEMAKKLGAIETINSKELDDRGVVGAVRKLTKGGADIAFEAIGNPITMKQAYNSLRTGGRLIAVGYSPKRWDGFDIGRVMFREMEIMGSLGCRPVDYPRIIELVKNGSLVVEPLVTHKFPLSEINDAFEVARRGEAIRAIILCQK
ncbi:MAG: zinc-binding dehydrogenase [Candidatus Hodarchaeales archaeon]|jgi:6-hydroxycyclohex-1-ene-1-carbonyl-CoA dehydrogenase